MSRGAEAAEHDIPRALALITVAMLAVLPEYAVDIIFVWKAGGHSAFAADAAANMTGSNRLLLGLGWPTNLGVVLPPRTSHLAFGPLGSSVSGRHL
jgi:cation:H+ antiporter